MTNHEIKESFLSYFKKIYQNDKDFGILNSFISKLLISPKEELDMSDFFEEKGSKINIELLCEDFEATGLIECVHESSQQLIYKLSDAEVDEGFFVVSKGSSDKSMLKIAKQIQERKEKDKVSYSEKESISISDGHTTKKYVSEKKEVIPAKELTEEEIEARAEIIITASESFTSENIISVFENIALPFYDGNGLKEALMIKVFDLSGIEADYQTGIGIVVPAKGKRKKVITSHIDLIPSFNKGFNKDRICEVNYEEGVVAGALDNTMTNAVALMACLKLHKEGKTDDVEFVFTEGEEIGLNGMKAYMRKNPSLEPFFINMDVTNDNWKSNVSIEYDYPAYKICTQISEGIPNAGMTDERWCDDFDVIADRKGAGFSYCLPTKETIHSYKNYTLISKLVPYLNGLVWLINELDTKKREHDIEYLSIPKAMKCESYKKFKKKEEKAKTKYLEKEKKKRTSSTSSWSRDWTDSSWSGRTTTISNDIDGISTGGQRFFDFGGLKSEEEMEEEARLRESGYYPQGFDEADPTAMLDDYFDENEWIGEIDVRNLEHVVSDAVTTLEHNGVKVDRFLGKFIHEHTYAQDQWTLDDLADFIADIEKAKEITFILEDNFLVENIESGAVFKFPKKSDYSL